MGAIRSTTANATFSPGVYDDGVSTVTVAYTYYGDANDDDTFVFVSVWRDLESLQAFRGTDLDDPGILPHEADVIQEAVVEHYLA